MKLRNYSSCICLFVYYFRESQPSVRFLKGYQVFGKSVFSMLNALHVT